MVKYAWVGFGSVACGVAIATVSGGASPWGALVVLAALTISIAMTVAVRRRHQPARSPIEHVRTKRELGGQTQLGVDHVSRPHETVSDRTVGWLGAQDFGSTWHDTPLQPLRQLCDVDPTAGARGNSSVEAAIASLVTASLAFLDFYDRNTRPDALMVDSGWRELGSPETRNETQTRDAADGIRAQLIGRAADTIEAWRAVVAIEAQTKQRRRIPRHGASSVS
jgi:hypothetical protein